MAGKPAKKSKKQTKKNDEPSHQIEMEKDISPDLSTESVGFTGKTIWFILSQSWGGWIAFALGIDILVGAHGHLGHGLLSPGAVGGALVLIGAVMGMNGLAKTESIMAHRTPAWWRKRPFLKILNYTTSEGELAGIAIGILLLAINAFTGGSLIHHFHFPLVEFMTILGIMSAASLTARNLLPVLGVLEKIGGPRLAIFGGSILSSLTGEPAAAKFLTLYINNRVKQGRKSKVATLLALTIGSGGGLMYHAAPPILIVWSIMQSQFNWTLVDLVLKVGIVCVAHVAIGALLIGKHLNTAESDPVKKSDLIPLAGLVVLVLLHLFYPGTYLWVLDVIIGVINIDFMHMKYSEHYMKVLEEKKYLVGSPEIEADHELEHIREERFSNAWQPLILASLLFALEVIGVTVEPFIIAISELINPAMPVLLVAAITFALTAITSHFADNALASRIYVTVAVALIPVLGAGAELIAIGVLYGALFGGFLMIPANLPNFAIARSLHIKPGSWVKAAWKWYPTGVIHLIGLVLWSLLIL